VKKYQKTAGVDSHCTSSHTLITVDIVRYWFDLLVLLNVLQMSAAEMHCTELVGELSTVLYCKFICERHCMTSHANILLKRNKMH